MCGGDVSKAVQNVSDAVSNATGSSSPLESLGNILIDAATVGITGNPDLINYRDGKIVAGNIKSDWRVRAIDEAVGEVSGRNLARHQAALAQAAIDQANAQQQQQIKDQQQRNYNLDVQKSTTVGLLTRYQNLKSSSASNNINSMGSASGTLTRDFLGL